MKNITGQEWVMIIVALGVAGVATYRTINPAEPTIVGEAPAGTRENLIKTQRITTGVVAVIFTVAAVYMFFKFKKAK